MTNHLTLRERLGSVSPGPGEENLLIGQRMSNALYRAKLDRQAYYLANELDGPSEISIAAGEYFIQKRLAEDARVVAIPMEEISSLAAWLVGARFSGQLPRTWDVFLQGWLDRNMNEIPAPDGDNGIRGVPQT